MDKRVLVQRYYDTEKAFLDELDQVNLIGEASAATDKFIEAANELTITYIESLELPVEIRNLLLRNRSELDDDLIELAIEKFS